MYIKVYAGGYFYVKTLTDKVAIFISIKTLMEFAMNRPAFDMLCNNGQVEIHREQYPESPRDEDYNLGTMICFRSRNIYGDTHDYRREDFVSLDDVLDRIEADNGPVVYLPVYLYDHSGVTINTTGFPCPWDSGQIGWIYITLAKIREEYGYKRVSKKLRERIKGYLINEVATYDNFLTGDVFGYSVEVGGEEHSCWGYYGYDHEKSGLLESVRAELGV